MSLSKCFISSPFSKVKTRKHSSETGRETTSVQRINCAEKKPGTNPLNYLLEDSRRSLTYVRIWTSNVSENTIVLSYNTHAHKKNPNQLYKHS